MADDYRCRMNLKRQLIVVIGAGASFDCAHTNTRPIGDLLPPPLVADLFQPNHMKLLDEYPLAHAAATDILGIKHEVANHSGEKRPTFNLEKYLRTQLKEAADPHVREQFWTLPYYFQHLLLNRSREFAPHVENYVRLVNALLTLPSVLWVTFNYDTLLDNVLERFAAPRVHKIDDYISNPRSRLVKLHGSVNWGVRLEGIRTTDFGSDADLIGAVTTMLADGSLDMRADQPELLPNRAAADISTVRRKGAEAFYPAISVPLGEDDEFSCPTSHVEHLTKHLDQQVVGYGLDMLIIGYSCLDKSLLTLLRESSNRIRSLTIVNGSERFAREAYARLQHHLGGATPVDGRPGDHVDITSFTFSDFALPTNLRRFVERVKPSLLADAET
jgi:hypothetical protein